MKDQSNEILVVDGESVTLILRGDEQLLVGGGGGRMSKESDEFIRGFRAAVEMIKIYGEDVYGIGHMCSMWTSDEIANDILARMGLSPTGETND